MRRHSFPKGKQIEGINQIPHPEYFTQRKKKKKDIYVET